MAAKRAIVTVEEIVDKLNAPTNHWSYRAGSSPLSVK